MVGAIKRVRRKIPKRQQRKTRCRFGGYRTTTVVKYLGHTHQKNKKKQEKNKKNEGRNEFFFPLETPTFFIHSLWGRFWRERFSATAFGRGNNQIAGREWVVVVRTVARKSEKKSWYAIKKN